MKLGLTKNTSIFYTISLIIKFLLVINPDFEILIQVLTILFPIGEPASFPSPGNDEPITNGVNFTSHKFSFCSYSRSRKTMVRCEERRSNGLNRPRAPNRRHLRVGASSAVIWYTTRSSRLTPKFSSALAIAEPNSFSRIRAAFLGVYFSILAASTAFLPRTRSTTRRAFCAEMSAFFK